MENFLTSVQKMSIQWVVQAPSLADSTVFSENFLCQDQNCNLKYYSGQYRIADPYLSFISAGELQWPVTVAVRVVSNAETLDYLIKSISKSDQKIWTYKRLSVLTNRRLIFDLIFFADCLNGDRCIQTASYLNKEIGMGSLQEDFSKLLETGDDYDVKVKCGEKSMKLHKLVLGARSEIFRTMLLSDATGVIQIQDIEVTYFHDFIKYLYTDELSELTLEKAKALYRVGDKYDVQSLMCRCAEYLQDNLSPENAFECYSLAEAHGDTDLTDTIKTYLLDKKIYLLSEYWLPFYENFPDVALEVYKLSYENK